MEVCRCLFDPFIYHGRSVNARLILIGRAGGPPYRQPYLVLVGVVMECKSVVRFLAICQYRQCLRYRIQH
jgi:hypothetical protein